MTDQIEGQSFENSALTGSGTILPNGEGYGEPEPDPTLVRGLGPDKTSGGRLVTGGGLADGESQSTAESVQSGSKPAPAAQKPAAAPKK